jgi:hypothetical protein
MARGAPTPDQARVRRGGLRGRPPVLVAAVGPHGRPDQARRRRPGVLRAGTGRPVGPSVPGLEVPLDGRGLGRAIRSRAGRRTRRAGDPGRPPPAGHGHGRAASALEHPPRRHELRGPAGLDAARDRGEGRPSPGATGRSAGVRTATPRRARSDRPGPGLRGPRPRAAGQVPLRRPLCASPGLLAGPAAGSPSGVAGRSAGRNSRCWISPWWGPDRPGSSPPPDAPRPA